MDLPPLPPAIVQQVSTQRYHLSFTFDMVSNATWYSVITKTNGVEAFRRYSMTNLVTVSNLYGDLERYTFVAIATNGVGESEETPPAPKHLVFLHDGTNTLTLNPTNQSQFFTNLHPMYIEGWSFYKELRKDP